MDGIRSHYIARSLRREIENLKGTISILRSSVGATQEQNDNQVSTIRRLAEMNNNRATIIRRLHDAADARMVTINGLTGDVTRCRDRIRNTQCLLNSQRNRILRLLSEQRPAPSELQTRLDSQRKTIVHLFDAAREKEKWRVARDAEMQKTIRDLRTCHSAQVLTIRKYQDMIAKADHREQILRGQHINQRNTIRDLQARQARDARVIERMIEAREVSKVSLARERKSRSAHELWIWKRLDSIPQWIRNFFYNRKGLID